MTLHHPDGEDNVKKQPIVVTAGRAETLNVMGGQVSLLCRGEATDRAWCLMEAVLPKDQGPPPHEHPWDECYYVVEGRVRFSLDGCEHLLGAGDFAYAPAGTPHGFSGDSEHAAHMLIFDAPAHAEGFFREVEREVKEMPRDLAKVPEIGERHQIHFLRP
jgi:quercetin dioxygenase-like cupin family protein